ncbi:MAG TPA: helix-turn-helix transcriptional regulator [Vicinamibacterales bacterium]|nr:helix-turn-helix transcriptional regulator [Vicinamibacterales bacterium]
MPDSFGTRLRLQRERQQVALVSIADRTKISVALLADLERDDVSHWPGGIFRRAFVRDYAQAIGLEPDVVLQEFLALHPDPAQGSLSAVAPTGPDDPVEAAAEPTERLRSLVGSATGLLARVRFHLASRRGPDADRPAIEPPPARVAVGSSLDLPAAARLCTRLGQIDCLTGAAPFLSEAVTVLGAIGLIVWVRDGGTAGLRPALAYGYPDHVLAHLPGVHPDADHATARAFRSAQWTAVDATDRATGALVVPLLTLAGCVGGLAFEFPRGSIQTESTRAVAIILAAQFARLIGPVESAEAALPSQPLGATRECSF